MLTRVLAFLVILGGSATFASAQRADAVAIDGIYQGTMGMQITGPRGKAQPYQAPSKLVVMPDGKAVVLLAEHPDGVVSVTMRGSLRGLVFLGQSKGKMDYGGYNYAMQWDVTFNPRAGTAVLHGKTLNLPKWAKEDDDRYTFRKVPAKSAKPAKVRP